MSSVSHDCCEDLKSGILLKNTQLPLLDSSSFYLKILCTVAYIVCHVPYGVDMLYNMFHKTCCNYFFFAESIDNLSSVQYFVVYFN